jgi:hypothetical protein
MNWLYRWIFNTSIWWFKVKKMWDWYKCLQHDTYQHSFPIYKRFFVNKMRNAKSLPVSYCYSRVFHQLYWFDFWGSIDLNGPITTLMPIWLHHWKPVRAHFLDCDPWDFLGGRWSCHLLTQWRTRRYVCELWDLECYSLTEMILILITNTENFGFIQTDLVTFLHSHW